jgi:hypothetical protein
MLLGYDPAGLLLAFGAGSACGFLNTAASSGSVVTLPIMIFLGLDAATANATNRLPVLVGALSGALDFARRKALPWRLAFRIAVPTMIGSLIGAEHQEGDRAGPAERGPIGAARVGAVLRCRHLAWFHRAGRRYVRAPDPHLDGGG